MSMKLETLAFNHKVYEEYKWAGLQGLNRLLEIWAHKENLKAQFQAMDISQKAKQQWQQFVQGRIAEIHLEITQLQAELDQLQPKLSAVTTNLKVDSKSKLQLYNQAKALDGEIHTLEEREQILRNEVESDT